MYTSAKQEELAAIEEAQLLITRLRGVLTVRITEEWSRPNRNTIRVVRLRAERDALLDHRETLDLKPLPEIEELASNISKRLRALA